MTYYGSIAQIQAANRNIGGHFFDADTLKFFNCRVHSATYSGCAFVTSEQDRHGAWGGQRRYTIRFCFDGQIESAEFGEFDNSADAHKAARRRAYEALEARA